MIVSGFLTAILCPTGWAEQITLYWQPNAGDPPEGYNVYCRPASGAFQLVKDAGTQTSTTVMNLEQGKTYYFAVKAYNVYGKESDFSEEIAYTVPVPGAPTPTSEPMEQPTATSTPTSSAAPNPVVTPTNTPMPVNTPTNTAVPTKTATWTPVPTATPTSTATPVPTATPTSTKIPVPTATPTATPTVTPTPQPVETPPDSSPADVLTATFETNNFSEWDQETDSGNDLKISTSSPYSGSYCAQFTYNDTNPEYLSAAVGETAEGRIAFQIRFNLNNKWSNLPTAFLKLYSENGMELLSGEYLYQDKKIKYFSRIRTVEGWNEGAWNVLTADSNWHRLEIQFKIHDTDGYQRVLIDGQVVHEAAGLRTNALAGQGAVNLRVGNISGLRNGVNSSFYLDNGRFTRVAGTSGLTAQSPIPTNTPAVNPAIPSGFILADVFDSGFETGTFSDWNGEKDLGNDLGISSTGPHSGRRTAKLIYNDQTPEYLIKNLEELGEGAIAFWIKFDLTGVWNSDPTTLLQAFNQDGTELLYGGFKYAEGGIQYFSRLRVFNNWDESVWHPLTSDSQWHHIEVQFKIHPTDGYHRVLIDNRVVHSMAGLASDVFDGLTVNKMTLGFSSSLREGVNGTLYIDDVSVATRPGDGLVLGQMEMPPSGAAGDEPEDPPVPTATPTPTQTPTTAPTLVPVQPQLPDSESTRSIGFETADFSEWTGKVDTGNDLNISVFNAHGGTKSALFSCDDLTPEYLIQDLNQAMEGRISVWFQFDLSGQWNTASTPVIKIYNANGIELLSGEIKREGGVIRYYSRFRVYGGWDESVWTNLAADSKWHQLEVRYKIHATEGYHQVWIDGAPAHQSAGLNSDVFNGAPAGTLHLGSSQNLREGTNANYFVDDVTIGKF